MALNVTDKTKSPQASFEPTLEKGKDGSLTYQHQFYIYHNPEQPNGNVFNTLCRVPTWRKMFEVLFMTNFNSTEITTENDAQVEKIIVGTTYTTHDGNSANVSTYKITEVNSSTQKIKGEVVQSEENLAKSPFEHFNFEISCQNHNPSLITSSSKTSFTAQGTQVTVTMTFKAKKNLPEKLPITVLKSIEHILKRCVHNPTSFQIDDQIKNAIKIQTFDDPKAEFSTKISANVSLSNVTAEQIIAYLKKLTPENYQQLSHRFLFSENKIELQLPDGSTLNLNTIKLENNYIELNAEPGVFEAIKDKNVIAAIFSRVMLRFDVEEGKCQLTLGYRIRGGVYNFGLFQIDTQQKMKNMVESQVHPNSLNLSLELFMRDVLRHLHDELIKKPKEELSATPVTSPGKTMV